MKLVLILFSLIALQDVAQAQVMAQAELPTFHSRKDNPEALKRADAVDAAEFNKEYENFITVLEKNFVFRESVRELLRKYPTAERSGETYQKWVYTIVGSANEYLEARKNFLSIATKYSVYEDRWNDNTLPLLTKKKMMLAVASALVLYDNYFAVINVVIQNDDIRRILNQGDETNKIPKGILDSIASQAKNMDLRNKLSRQIHAYDKFISKFPANQIDEQLYYLFGVVNSSASYKTFREGVFSQILEFLLIRLNDGPTWLRDATLSRLPRWLMNLISEKFGNTVGLIETRKGKMHPQVQPQLVHWIEPQLKPLDILLEKTPFRLTDRFIPGHWGHVAIWIGSRKQLEQEGLWDLITDEKRQPAWRAMPFGKRKRIIDALTNGKVILEALRPGVQLNSLGHFLNVDDFLVVRPQYLQNNLERKAELIAQTLTHFEKEYDFNFDVKTADKIVCSELAYWTFPDINWRTETALAMTVVLARQSISPDNIIHTVLNQKDKFSPVMLFHDGKEVPEEGLGFYNELCALQRDSTLNTTSKGCL